MNVHVMTGEIHQSVTQSESCDTVAWVQVYSAYKWALQAWKDMTTSSPNKSVELSAKILNKDTERER